MRQTLGIATLVWFSATIVLTLMPLAHVSGQEITPASPQEVITLNRLPVSDAAAESAQPQPDQPPPPPSPHPLLPALKVAYDSYDYLNNQVRDYSCRVVKQERVNGRLLPLEHIDVKVRHQQQHNGRLVLPRATYLKFLAPEHAVGREVLWVEGQNDGKMIVRRGGRRFNYITVQLDPQSESAMRDSNYPITDSGMKLMVRKLIDVGRDDMKYGECEVKFFQDVKVDGRDCTCIQILHPRRRSQFIFHIARIYVDDEYPIPLRYEAYDWPESEGGKPPLLEQFTFQHVKLNVGFSDAEFRRNYPDYNFRN